MLLLYEGSLANLILPFGLTPLKCIPLYTFFKSHNFPSLSHNKFGFFNLRITFKITLNNYTNCNINSKLYFKILLLFCTIINTF